VQRDDEEDGDDEIANAWGAHSNQMTKHIHTKTLLEQTRAKLLNAAPLV